MPVSKITSKYQTTVPKEVRERLSIGSNDSLDWEIQNGSAIVRPAGSNLSRWAGYIKVGSGSTVADVRHARRLRGKR
jgi:AbrB family looped-hinge helix DNA binding protein